MDIRIKGIGIINDSTINLDGLTIVTGKNNSGKTTLGKTLYSYLEAISDIPSNAAADKNFYVYKNINKLLDNLQILKNFRLLSNQEKNNNFFQNVSTLDELLKDNNFRYNNNNNYESIALKLKMELEYFILHSNYLLNDIDDFYKKIYKEEQNIVFSEFLIKTINESLTRLDNMLRRLNQDPTLIAYTQERINQMFNLEFADQIQPVINNATSSLIEISDDNSPKVVLNFENNNLKFIKDKQIYNSFCKNVFMIDDPFVIDDTHNIFAHYGSLAIEDSVTYPSSLVNHEEKLKLMLKLKGRQNPFEKTVLDGTLKLIKEKIDTVIPGSFEFSDDGDFYVLNGKKLKTSNLATGSKLFSIIKILLEKGAIDNTTMLIFDEPEAHLHPDWQNIFAEIIALLVKEMGVKVILTTHSPNFVLALEANMRRYGIEKETNFYKTKTNENGLVDYECVNDNIEVIYADFLDALSASKIIREKFLNNN